VLKKFFFFHKFFQYEVFPAANFVYWDASLPASRQFSGELKLHVVSIVSPSLLLQCCWMPC